jgi:hypothetical protein
VGRYSNTKITFSRMFSLKGSFEGSGLMGVQEVRVFVAVTTSKRRLESAVLKNDEYTV